MSFAARGSPARRRARLEPEVAQEAGLVRREVDERGQGHLVGIAANADVAALRHLALESLTHLDRLVLGGSSDEQVAEAPLHREALLAELVRQGVRVPDV